MDDIAIMEQPLVKCTRCKSGTHHRITRKCSYCGSTDRYPTRRSRPSQGGRAGGKRGRNSGKVSQHGKK